MEEVAHAGVVAVAVDDLALEVLLVVTQLAVDVAELGIELVFLRPPGGSEVEVAISHARPDLSSPGRRPFGPLRASDLRSV